MDICWARTAATTAFLGHQVAGSPCEAVFLDLVAEEQEVVIVVDHVAAVRRVPGPPGVVPWVHLGISPRNWRALVTLGRLLQDGDHVACGQQGLGPGPIPRGLGEGGNVRALVHPGFFGGGGRVGGGSSGSGSGSSGGLVLRGPQLLAPFGQDAAVPEDQQGLAVFWP